MKRGLFYLIGKVYLLKVWIFAQFLGIDYVCSEVLHCSKRHIPGLLRQHGASIGTNVNFKSNIHIDNASGDQDATGDFANLSIGRKCFVGHGVFFDLPDQIVIEDECAISAGVKFITHSDCGNRPMSQWYPRRKGKIVIGYGSWIGVNAVILQGVVLGKCCVVAAGSVVSESFPDYSVIGGMPARVIRTLPHAE